MADQWIQEVQHHCTQLVSSLDHMRKTMIARLPGQQPIEIRDEVATTSFLAPKPTLPPKPSRHSLPTAAAAAGVTREDIGRATWLFLHTLAAQYPERPTRQQRRDAKALMDILTRMYPCGECAKHFKQVVAANPPQVKNKKEFSLWMCRVHNVVNRSLGKPSFNCDLVESRWAGVDCEEEDACSLEVGTVRESGKW